MTAIAGARLVALAAAAICFGAQAQSYPSKQITIVSSIGAGSPTDLECRAVAEYMKTSLKTAVVVEPKPGAGGSLAAQYVARAAPDGYTLFCSGPGLTTFKLLIKDLSFDPLRDLTPVSLMSDFVSLFVTNGQVPFKNLEGFIAYAKANPGKLNYASAGKNTVLLSMEAVKKAAAIRVTEIPFPGTPQAVLSLLRNDVQLVQASVDGVRGQIESGQIRPILINGYKRAVLYPDVPTLADMGWDVPRNTWTGLFAPAGTPKPIVDRLAGEVAQYAVSPEAKKREQAGSIIFTGSTPEQFRQQVDSDARRWEAIATELGWKPE